MWQKTTWMGHRMNLELIREGFTPLKKPIIYIIVIYYVFFYLDVVA